MHKDIREVRAPRQAKKKNDSTVSIRFGSKIDYPFQQKIKVICSLQICFYRVYRRGGSGEGQGGARCQKFQRVCRLRRREIEQGKYITTFCSLLECVESVWIHEEGIGAQL